MTGSAIGQGATEGLATENELGEIAEEGDAGQPQPRLYAVPPRRDPLSRLAKLRPVSRISFESHGLLIIR